MGKGLDKGLMHGWVDQFAIESKSLFIQNNLQNLEIKTSLY
jgi:hypothetical protein